MRSHHHSLPSSSHSPLHYHALVPPALPASPTLPPLHYHLRWRPWPHHFSNSSTLGEKQGLSLSTLKKYEGSFEFMHLQYHMGPILTANIIVHPIWYGTWLPSQKHTIRSFLHSIYPRCNNPPFVSAWQSTVHLYTDQTNANSCATTCLDAKKTNRFYSHGHSLTRLCIQSVTLHYSFTSSRPLPVNPYNGIYLLLTSLDILFKDFYGQVCSFHSSPSPP